MSNASGYKIYPSSQLESSSDGSFVYVATYTIEDKGGLRGEPITVAGTFQSAEEAIEAAQAAGEKLLSQMH
jgi:hypothetical protein